MEDDHLRILPVTSASYQHEHTVHISLLLTCDKEQIHEPPKHNCRDGRGFDTLTLFSGISETWKTAGKSIGMRLASSLDSSLFLRTGKTSHMWVTNSNRWFEKDVMAVVQLAVKIDARDRNPCKLVRKDTERCSRLGGGRDIQAQQYLNPGRSGSLISLPP